MSLLACSKLLFNDVMLVFICLTLPFKVLTSEVNLVNLELLSDEYFQGLFCNLVSRYHHVEQ